MITGDQPVAAGFNFAQVAVEPAGCVASQLYPHIGTHDPAGAPALHPVARAVAFGPRYGLPPYHAPLVKRVASGNVAGPPPATSPNGFACTGLLWSWHHSK